MWPKPAASSPPRAVPTTPPPPPSCARSQVMVGLVASAVPARARAAASDAQQRLGAPIRTWRRKSITPPVTTMLTTISGAVHPASAPAGGRGIGAQRKKGKAAEQDACADQFGRNGRLLGGMPGKALIGLEHRILPGLSTIFSISVDTLRRIPAEGKPVTAGRHDSTLASHLALRDRGAAAFVVCCRRL